MGGKRSGKGEREREREREEGNEANLRSPFWAKSRGYSAFQYILPDLTPKTNRCASRFATTASALRASAAVRGPKARLFSAAFCSPHWFEHMRHHQNLDGSRPLADNLLDIKYADPAKWIQAIWGQRNFWKAIGTTDSPFDPPRPPSDGAVPWQLTSATASGESGSSSRRWTVSSTSFPPMTQRRPRSTCASESLTSVARPPRKL